MALKELQRTKRKELTWLLLGFVAIQAGLSAGIERCWTAIRDPEYAMLERLIRARQAEAPGRPLVVALGSSRTAMGLRTGRLNDLQDPTSPVVVNCAIFGSGPMMQCVVLKRLLDAGMRPRLVFVEAIPMSLSRRENGDAVEAKYMDPRRLTAAELARVWGYSATTSRLTFPWAWIQARGMPISRYQAELRKQLGPDVAPGKGRFEASSRDAYGWSPRPKSFTPQEIEKGTKATLQEYHLALTNPDQAPGAIRALHDTLALCRDAGVEAVLVTPPVSRAFRDYCPAVEQQQWSALCDLASEFGVSQVDARAWVDDDGFFDGHHAYERGADQYTDRFGKEVIAPRVASWHSEVEKQPKGSGAPMNDPFRVGGWRNPGNPGLRLSPPGLRLFTPRASP